MRKNIFQKTASFLMACAVAASATVSTAFAVEPSRSPYPSGSNEKFTITIKSDDPNFKFTANYKYNAYQLFSGNLVVESPTKEAFLATLDGEYDDWEAYVGDIGEDDAEAAFDAYVKEKSTIAGLNDLGWGSGFGSDVTTDTKDENGQTIEGGNGIPDSVDPFLKALRGLTGDDFVVEGINVFEGVTSPQQLADVLNDQDDNSEFVKAFAQIAANNLSVPFAGAVTSFTEASYVISGLDPGYYIVKDETDKSNLGNAKYSKSLPIVEIAGDLTVYLKNALPSLDKSIKDATGGYNDRKNATVGVGDEVSFELEVKLPKNYTEYHSYYLSFTDTLPLGLTLDQTSYKLTFKHVQDDGETAADTDKSFAIKTASSKFEPWDPDWEALQPAEGTEGFSKDVIYYQVTDATDTTGTKLKIIIPDVQAFAAANNVTLDNTDFIFLEYKTIVNANATNAADGKFENNAEIEYSNNPNNSTYGDLTSDDTDDDTDKRTDKANVNVFEIDFDKNDGDTKAANHKHLAGAEFTITNGNNTAIVRDNGDGSYTFVAWANLTNAFDMADWAAANEELLTNIFVDFDVTSDDFIETLKTTVVTADATSEFSSMKIKGLAPGAYTFTETTAPTGYQKVDPFTVYLEAEVSWTETYMDGEEEKVVEFNNKSYSEYKAHKESSEPKITVGETVYDVTEISDAVFSGNLYYSVTTGEGLVYADYSTKADGSENATVKIDTTKHIAQLNVIDDPTNGLPSTGGAGAYLYYICGAILALAGTGILLFSRKKSAGRA